MGKNMKITGNKIAAVASLMAIASPLTATAQNYVGNNPLANKNSLGAANTNLKKAESSVSVNGGQVFVTYQSNLDTNLQQFFMPETGKIIVDFLGVRVGDKVDSITDDKIVEKVQLIQGSDKARLVITVKKEIIEYYKTLGKKLSANDIVVTQAPDQTTVSFRPEIIAAAQIAQKQVLVASVAAQKEDLSKRFETVNPTSNISDDVKAETEARAMAQVRALNENQRGNAPIASSFTTAKTGMENAIKSNAITLEKINFSKYNGGTGRLTLDLSNASAFANVKKADNLLIIEVPGLVISPSLKKKIITSQLGLATKSVDILENDAGVKIIVENAGYWEHSLSQADNKVSIDIRTLNEAQAKQKAELEAEKNKSYNGKAITLNFQNMEVRALLQVIADFTGINVVASEKVQGAMTIKLNNVPWEQALDIILESKDLTKVMNGNVLWVATREEYNTKQKALIESQAQTYELEPIKLMTYQLNYHKASEIAAFLLGGKSENASASAAGGGGAISKTEGGSNRVLSKKGAVNFDSRNNILFVQDTQAKLDEVTKIIKRLDASSRQVLVEAKIVIADEKFSRDLGVRYGLQLSGGGGANRFGVGSDPSGALRGANGQNVTSGSTGSSVSLPGTLIGLAAGTGASAIAFSILNANTGNALSLELSAMEEQNRGRVVSSPRIVTFDNQKAVIEQGTEIPYVTPGTGNSPPTVAFKKAVLGLGVTPQISPNGRINLNLDIRKDTVGELVSVQGGGTVPSIDTRNIQTQVTVKNGQTIILGGVFESISREDLRKVPFLGDLPIVGNFFRNSIKGKDRAELLMFITPYIIEDSALDSEGPVESVEVKRIE